MIFFNVGKYSLNFLVYSFMLLIPSKIINSAYIENTSKQLTRVANKNKVKLPSNSANSLKITNITHKSNDANNKCKYRTSNGVCLYSMKVWKSNVYPQKIYIFRTGEGASRKALIYKSDRVRHSNLFNSKPKLVPLRYWRKSDWNNYSNRNKYTWDDKYEFLYDKQIAKEKNGIKTVITPGGATLTIRRNTVVFEDYTTENSKLSKFSLALKNEASFVIPGTDIKFGVYNSISGNIEKVEVKSETVSNAVLQGDTEYTNACFTICCPVFASAGIFQNIYRAKYAFTGSMWVDYLVFEVTYPNGKRREKYLRRETKRFNYDLKNQQFTFTSKVPGDTYAGIATELIPPNPVFPYCTADEAADKDGSCKAARKRVRNSPACIFGGAKP